MRIRAVAGAAIAIALLGASTPVGLAAASTRSGGGLLAAYAFNRQPGGVTADASGAGHIGALRDTRFATDGKYGDAISIAGPGSLVSIAGASSLNLARAMTIEAWVRPSAAGRNAAIAIKTGRGSAFPYGLSLRRGVPVATVTTATGTTRDSARQPLRVGVWSYLAATYNGSEVNLYVNDLPPVVMAARGALITTTGAIEVGSDRSLGENFVGAIDNIRLFNLALSASAIRKNAGQPVNGKRKGGPSKTVNAPATGTSATNAPTALPSATTNSDPIAAPIDNGLVPAGPTDTTPPTVSGHAEEGQTLTASPGTWSGSPILYAYQWQHCAAGLCSNIVGAIDSTYQPQSSDVDDTIEVVVTVSNGTGFGSATSAATPPVVASGTPPPSNTGAPTISGTAQQGDTLTASPGSWSNSPSSYAYQWQDCSSASSCTNINGATSSSYALQSSDVGDAVDVVLTATNGAGSGSANSAQTRTVVPPTPVNTGTPSISGTAAQGDTLTASPGSWSNSPSSYSYQWQDCSSACTSVSGATSPTYQVQSSDVGNSIDVVVTGTNAGGSASATSARTAVVTASPTAAPVNSATPTISGSTEEGQTLTAATGIWSNSPTSYAYQWQDCSSADGCVSISGATGSTYAPQSSDVGNTIEVAVTATNSEGSASAVSAPTQPVLTNSDPTFAGPTFLGNSFDGANYDSVPHSVMELAVSPNGYLMMGSSWEEDNHDARLFDPSSGGLLGPNTPTRPDGGIYGVAADDTYVYYASGNGLLYRSSLASWDNPSNNNWYDAGNNTGVGPLTVDSGGYQLMGLAECDGELFVADPDGPMGDSGQVSPNTSVIDVVPTSLSGVTASWSVPRARTIACDREGDIWVLQQGVSGGAGPDVERFTPSGTLLSSFSFPSGVYPTGLAADPNQDRLLVPDNGPDQDFKWYNYSGTQIGQIGVTGGYLAGPDPGVIGPDRFVGPRAAAIDPNGDVFTAESGDPGAGQGVWSDMGPAAIFTKFNSSGSVVWRDYGLDFAGTGEPTDDGSRFFDLRFEYTRDSNGNYQPYAFTEDPFSNPSDPRASTVYGDQVYERDLDGHHYIFQDGNEDNGDGIIYEQQPNSEIFAPVVEFDNNTAITTNGTQVNAPGSFDNRQHANDYWMDASGNVWTVGAWSQVWEYVLQGYAADGTPQYNWNNVNVYPWPSQISQSARRIEVVGNNVYISGFSSSDPNPNDDFDGWKSSGRHLLKFASLPTASGWPAPAWEYNFSYGTGTDPSSSPDETGYPTGFASDGPVVAVAWFRDPNTNQGEIETINDTTGTLDQTYSPTVSAYGGLGWFDLENSITAKNGWIWSEDDLQSKIYAICPSGSCT